ncbi:MULTISPECIES: YeiH family protein [unclassified Rubrivivax]|uniref:YeiH family protein n=1 Tax=unclassified Rubrivivax TaxID=2649762 RepID=UPI001E4DC3C2|nr:MULTISPECIES: putative sulfate exporter family transporter [unclassified Rubrivivax]MCC9598465.1 putative sulfate exporter family transporter [Rubrivivax sp. JA1055]MCC9648165.1 putative sulfate exporter family transporter [Rubrivivax sp. JA1029]
MRAVSFALPSSSMRARLPGLALAGAIAAAATALAAVPGFAAHGLGALTLAIVLGIAVGHMPAARHAATGPGIEFAKQRLLRWGIVLYGLRLGLADLGALGASGLVIDLLMVGTTFVLAYTLGRRVFGLDHRTTVLIGAGSSICGAAAVMACAPVLRGRADEVAVAVSTVVVFGTLAMFAYPLAYPLLGLDAAGFGLYVGSTLHEVAQVVAAARPAGESAADAAVVAKLARVMLLAPFLLLLSAWDARSGDGGTGRITVPWFALGFVGVVLLHPLLALPPAAVDALLAVDTALLAMAMAALGLTTHVSALRRAGARPLALAALLLVWLAVGGLAINLAVPALAG